MKILFDYIGSFLKKIWSFLFPNESLISDKLIEIMNNSIDRENYKKAILQSKKEERDIKILLTTGETLVVSFSSVTILS